MADGRGCGAKKRLGGEGEDAACDFLRGRGMEIEARNWRFGHKELDIVARCGNCVHVVEVKTRHASRHLALEELIHEVQAQRILEAADAYMQAHGAGCDVQIDIVVVVVGTGSMRVEYFPDAIRDSF